VITSDLINACVDGSDRAWRDLIRETSPALLGTARAMLQDRLAAEDALQETYLKVFQNLKRLRDRSRLAPWMYRILMNECRMILRARKSRPTASAEDFPLPFADPSDPTERLVDEATVDSLLAALPDKLREVFVLREMRGMDYREIATALRIPVGTVRSRLSRAREVWTEVGKAALTHEPAPQTS
jgi:RNA polymerase sigma-70 factor (ECF subfamily)